MSVRSGKQRRRRPRRQKANCLVSISALNGSTSGHHGRTRTDAQERRARRSSSMSFAGKEEPFWITMLSFGEEVLSFSIKLS